MNGWSHDYGEKLKRKISGNTYLLPSAFSGVSVQVAMHGSAIEDIVWLPCFKTGVLQKRQKWAGGERQMNTMGEKMGSLTEQRLQRKAISQSQHPTVRHARATMSKGTGRSMTSLKS